MQFGVFEKFTSAYLFHIAQEKSCDYLLISIKNFEMVKQKRRTCITQSGKNYAINCAIQGVRLIWKQKIWLAICKFLWSLTNQNAWFVSSSCTELTLFCTVFEKNCTALNQSEWRNFSCILLGGKQFHCQMSCGHELANEGARCSGKNASYITIGILNKDDSNSTDDPRKQCSDWLNNEK